MNTRLRARLVSFDHSTPGQQKTVIAGIVEGSLGHASHGEIIDCEIEIWVVRRIRSLVPLGDIVAAVANLGETPEMIERGNIIPTPDRVEELAKLFGVDAAALRSNAQSPQNPAGDHE